MKTIIKFFQDFLGSFLHFIDEGLLKPLFFRFPKIYDIIIAFIIILKNSIPNKFEISYTLNHWKYIMQKGMVDSLTYTTLNTINFIKFLNQSNINTLDKIERLMYVSNRDK